MGADDLPLLVGAGGFAQASEEGAIELARRVAALVEPAEKRVVELFAGSGTLSVLLAKSARSFVGVEIDKEAHASAKANLDARGITAKLVCSDAEAYSIPACDVVVLDPPRSGAKGAVEKLLTARPKRIVYVSCDPATLARDVARLRTGGYVLTAIETIELFPQTSHVETVVVLEPRKKRAKAHAGGAA
jgi:23S rRNA (uracil1939-C5)-methyltransferase